TEIQNVMAEDNAKIAAEERIEFRIGIHQGDIVVEDGDIFGDGVNVAARLEGLADPGGICVSARVQEDIAGKFAVRYPGKAAYLDEINHAAQCLIDAGYLLPEDLERILAPSASRWDLLASAPESATAQ